MTAMKNQTLIHSDVVSVILAVLEAHGFQLHELDAALAEVTARAVESLGRRVPATLREWQLLVAKVAARYAVEERGKAAPREPYHDGIEEDPDAPVPWHFFDDPREEGSTRRQVAVLLDMLDHGEMPEHAREILRRVGDGETPSEIARALNLTVHEVSARLRATRVRCFKRFSEVDVTFDVTGFIECLSEGDGEDADEKEGA